MRVIFDVGALVRPAFTAADFTATKWDTGEDKANFANDFSRFMAADFKPALLTEKLYRRLSMSFGHIAHYDRHGFLTAFFENLSGKVAFLERTMMWRPCGDPAWTYSDVERAVLKRLRACDPLTAYRQLRVAEVESTERELLHRLQAKYADGTAAARAPVLHCPPKAKRNGSVGTPADQSSLF
jgi:hypothetical protein